MPELALAFDIERTGSKPEHETIAIGASVMDENFNELDNIRLDGYFPKKHNFEQRCWNEFWLKNLITLNQIEYEGDLDKEDRQEEMIILFQEFRRKWEIKAKEEGFDLVLVSDNNVFDGGFINEMIFKYLPDDMPIPYRASDGKYDVFRQTSSVFKGLVSLADGKYEKKWGFGKRLSQIYNFPRRLKEHTHIPSDDAYGIAFDYQLANGISKGKIKRKDYYSKIFMEFFIYLIMYYIGMTILERL